MSQVHICEVGPRDGLQNAKQLMPTEAKNAWIDALAPAGVTGIEGGGATAFGCTLQGNVAEEEVARIAEALAQFCDGVALADTVGYANPAQVKRIFSLVKRQIGEKLEAAHFHNTRGLGLANALAAYEVGVRVFDSSMGGLGGCPFAPGASGNVITEDLVFMFESMGIATGIDLPKLFAAREVLVKGIPQEPLYGHTPL